MKYTPTLAAVAIVAGFAVLIGSAPTIGAAAAGDDKKQAAKPPANGEFRLGAGDKLRIEVYKDAQLSQSVQIRPDGKITMPLIGDLEAADRTPLELRDTIARRLTEYMTNPVVTVIVVEATPAIAYVVGEVNHPGVVTMQTGQLTVLQALAVAGGLKDFANTRNIRILRKSASGLNTIGFDYKEAVRGGTPVYLNPGDTVVVP